jgi:hypothetical protein
MGRQVNFFLDRRDLDRFEAFFWSSDQVVALSQPTPSADLVMANSLRPEAENHLRPWGSMLLAREADLDLIGVRLIEQQGYHLIDVSRSPVIEWSPAYDPATGRRSGRGRLWFPTGYWNDDGEFVEMPSGFLGWGDRLLRWVRRNWKKGPSGYYESPTGGPG